MNVLVFNVGSTTLKFACIDTDTGTRVTSGLVDRIGQAGGDAVDHAAAMASVFAAHQSVAFDVVAHRIVQGGDRFTKPVVVDADVMSSLEKLDTLAPLHNPPARRVVMKISEQFPDMRQVLLFDSAYYATLAPESYRYAIPDIYFDRDHIRRYGAHGISHQYVVAQARQHMQTLGGKRDAADDSIISLHLGGGGSVTATRGGLAVETSMGMTPLEGLVMATRCGDIDPAVVLHLMRARAMGVDEVDRLLNKQSGLLGMCGDADMRTILQRRELGDKSATLAIDVYVHRILKYIGAYFVLLGGADAIVFTAGVGENSVAIRSLVASRLASIGVQFSEARNQEPSDTKNVRVISEPDSAVTVLVIPTNEEKSIANQAAAVIRDEG